MDGTRFDDLTRSLARATSRRSLLRGLAGALAGGLTGARLDDAAAQRAPRQANGAPCTRATDCASFHCVDGVCCNTACTGQCESCATGACLPVSGPPVGTRPACPGSGGCRATCDGQTRTACAAWPGGEVACGAATCADGWLTTYTCGGNGSCVPTTTSCAPFGCDAAGTACASGCTSHDQCPGSSHCASGGRCVGDKALGSACTDGAECQHGFCANGVCCADACAGPCQACGADGFCGPAPDNSPCAGGLCCAGNCIDVRTDVAHCGACHTACPGAVCQRAVCAGGDCATAPLPDGSPCDDGLACTDPDTCQGSVCTGPSVVCPDPDSCHEAGACDTETGDCVYPAKDDGTECDDGNACTEGDTCQAGVCTGASIECDDGLACTTNTCDPASGCVHTLRDDACLIDGVCYPAGRHPDGLCLFCRTIYGNDRSWVPLAGPSCDDGLPCTEQDTCQADGACVGVVRAGACLIAGACYQAGERNLDAPCQVCDPDQSSTTWTNLPQGAACDDANACTHAEACDGQGVCQPSLLVVCFPTQPCQQNGTCDPATGACRYEPAPAGTRCRPAADRCAQDAVCDGASVACPAHHAPKPAGTLCRAAPTPCDTDVVCDGASLVCPDVPLACDDGLDCTEDRCHPEFGCLHEITPGFCLIRDLSAGGVQVCYSAGIPHPTDPCQVCEPNQNSFLWSERPDGAYCGGDDRCTEAATCQAGGCLPAPVVCPPSTEFCQRNECDPATGACGLTPFTDIQRGDTIGCERCTACLQGTCLGTIPLCRPPCEACDPVTATCRPQPAGTDCTTNCAASASCTDFGLCVPDATPREDVCTDPANECADLVCDAASGQCVHQPGADDGKICGNGCNTCRDGECLYAEELVGRLCGRVDLCERCSGGQDCIGDPPDQRCRGSCSRPRCGSCSECDPAIGICAPCEPCCDGECGQTPCGDGCCAENRECCHNRCCPTGETCCGTRLNHLFQYVGVCCDADEACCPVLGFSHGGATCCAPHQVCGFFGCA
ncbi:MAG: hypothetical protein ACRDJW_12445 [Thermomicrobiales bacterium]